MDKFNEYRVQAEYCRRMAERTVSETDKAEWLRLAAYWLGMVPSTDMERGHHRAHPTTQQQQPQSQN